MGRYPVNKFDAADAADVERIRDMASKAQVDRFREAARELGCDESEERFDAALRKVASSPPTPKPTPKSKPGAKKGTDR